VQKRKFLERRTRVIESEITKRKFPAEKVEKHNKPKRNKKVRQPKPPANITEFASASPRKKFEELNNGKSEIRVWNPRK
jgi:hypothetical protein